MSTSTIVVPDFQFSGFYYGEIVRRIRIFNRINAPEITAEVPEEPFIQLERTFGLVGHYCNVLLDLAANEVLLPTAKLQDSVRLLLALIDYQIKDYAPASVELLLKLAQVPTSLVPVLEEDSLFETERNDDGETVPFEVADAVSVGPSNVLDGVFGLQLDRQGADGATVVGDPTVLQSGAMAVTAADLNAELELTGSVLGNNGTFKISEVITTGATSRIRLSATLGGEEPLFLFETGLTWKIRKFTANGASDVNTGGVPYFTPWTGRVAGDKLYVGSSWVLWTKLELAFRTLGANMTGVWEYYDPDLSDETPDSVSNQGTYLKVQVDGLLDPDGASLDRSGALVKVTYLPTGVSETLVSYWDGPGNYVDTSAFLGQSGTPSTALEDYAVGTDWNPLEGATDGSADLSADGDLEYTLPQTLLSNWSKVEVEGVEGFYLRFRVISTSGAGDPEIDTLSIAGGDQYLLEDGVQGETVSSEPLYSSTGTAKQEVELSTTPGLRDSVRVFVDEGGGEIEWTNLTAIGETLLTSGSKDRHFAVKQDSTGTLTVRFGDGTRGKIPPIGVENVRFEYRVNAVTDGNVGAGTVVVNSGGAALVSEVTNPRPAFGWREAEGASPESLELVKEAGPASLRTGNRAVNPSDYEDLALAFTASNGTRPVVRAKAIEEGFGPKTIKLVVVGTNGVAISATVKAELETYFNGNEAEGIEGVGQSNTEVTVVNFTPRLIVLSMTVEATSALTETLVKTRMATLLNPTAAEGGTYVWKFGGRAPNSRIASEVFKISPGNVFDVDISLPSADVELLEDELPLLDTAALNVAIYPPSN